MKEIFLNSGDDCLCKNMKFSDSIFNSYILWARIENTYHNSNKLNYMYMNTDQLFFHT